MLSEKNEVFVLGDRERVRASVVRDANHAALRSIEVSREQAEGGDFRDEMPELS
jgi:hypothetical protein